MDVLTMIGAAASVVGGVATWYYATKKKRLVKTIDEHQKKIKTIEDYASGTGYKIILRDCFHAVSYAFSIIFISIGLSGTLYALFPNEEMKIFLMQVVSAVFLGAGLVFFDLFRVLSKTFRAKESITAMNQKLQRLESEREVS